MQNLSKEINKTDCLFCNLSRERIIDENEFMYVIRDNFPVTEYHSLVIPKRHVAFYFDLTQAEVECSYLLLQKHKKNIQAVDGSVTGFNVGINIGVDAGQTIFHCHIHLIPRRLGDVKVPKGGVRGVIPEKQIY